MLSLCIGRTPMRKFALATLAVIIAVLPLPFLVIAMVYANMLMTNGQYAAIAFAGTSLYAIWIIFWFAID